MLTNERIRQMRADAISDPRCVQEFWYMLMARAIEAEATAPLVARIAELEKELATVKDGYDIMGLAEEQRQKPGPFSGRFTPNAVMKEQR